MKNLTEVSLKNRDMVWYFIGVIFIAGIISYFSLGRMEDPSYTVRQMIVSAAWPGASASEMEEQVTDKIEKKLQDVPGLDYIKSYSQAGKAVIYVTLKDTVPSEDIRMTWRDVRNFCEDEKKNLPSGVYGPYYNDRFDDVFGSIYAITGDGYSYEELRQEAEKLRREILLLPTIQKVELIGEQSEKVYIETEISKLMKLGISQQEIAAAFTGQNQITAGGMIETSTDNVYLRVTGKFENLEEIRNMPFKIGGRILHLSDIATVERKFVSPSEPKMFYNGKPAIGIAASMEPGGDILELGEELDNLIWGFQQDLPLGMEIGEVSDQPGVVSESIDEFVGSLREAVIIVLIVTFMSLGIRTGMVVALCIPLVLAGTFCVMYMLGIDLHKVSLGALIISLGMLVDDEMIAVEMMVVKLEQGMERFEAACYAFRETAMPMLTGTLITCSGFIPVAFSSGPAAEFCKALFPVIATALSLSWFVAIFVTPLFGYYLIRTKDRNNDKNDDKKSADSGKSDLYNNKFYVYFNKVLVWSLRHRKVVLLVTVVVFALSMGLFKVIRKEFFPTSLRPELIVEMTLPEGSSKKASEAEAMRLAKFLDEEKERIENYALYVGKGTSRFVLTVEPKLPMDNYAEFVITAKDTKQREYLKKAINEKLAEEFPNVRSNVKYISLGPPAAYPIMLRVSGYDKDKVREIAQEVGRRVAADPNNINVHLDWNEKTKALHLKFDQAKLRALGVTSQGNSQTLYAELNGMTVGQYYKDDRTIGIDLRLRESDRYSLERIKELPVYLGAAGYVPLEQVAEISFELEDGLIWRRNLKPAITVQAGILAGTANDATQKAYDSLKDIRDNLPAGYSITVDGALHDSNKAMKYIMAPLPAMFFIIMTLLMIQLRSGKKVALTLLTLPLGLVGVAIGMFVFDSAIGFVAVLGVLSLSGMIIRNSIILLDQIRLHLEAGESQWQSIIDSTVLRFRPILLTAGSSILGMVPLIFSSFWGPMAVAIASGLLIATALTLLVLPVMYAEVYRVKEE